MLIEYKIVRKRDISIILDFMKDYYDIEGIIFNRNKSKNALENLISKKDIGRLWMIQSDNKPIGYFA